MQLIWYQFWFKAVDVRQFACLRIAYGFLITLYLCQLMPFAVEHYSAAGWLTDVSHKQIANWGSWSLFNLNAGRFDVVYCYGLFIVGIIAALLMMLGWKTRRAIFITWLILVSLWNKNPLILDGDDAVLRVMALYLLFSPCGDAWSKDAQKKPTPKLTAIWPLRLIQFQIALLYFVSGWVKFHSTEWLDGSILQYVLIHPQYARFNLAQLLQHDLFISLLAIVADIIRWWELLFPFLLFNRYCRRLSLIIGVIFHIGLFLFMTLRWFPIVMLAFYPALLSNLEFICLINWAKNCFRALKLTRVFSTRI